MVRWKWRRVRRVELRHVCLASYRWMKRIHGEKKTPTSWCPWGKLIDINFNFKVNYPFKHTAKATQEWLGDNSVNVLEWPSQSPDLNPIEHLWRDLKMAVHLWSPSNLTELENLQRRMAENPPIQLCKACCVIPKKTQVQDLFICHIHYYTESI